MLTHEEIKREKRRPAAQHRRRYPRPAPALQRAARPAEGECAGLDKGAAAVREKVNEELGEPRSPQQGDAAQIEEELGDLLFTVAQLARHLKVEPEGALRKATRKFTKRIEHIEASLDQADQTWEQVDDVERLWDEAKSS